MVLTMIDMIYKLRVSDTAAGMRAAYKVGVAMMREVQE
jgi:hypothetical protein